MKRLSLLMVLFLSVALCLPVYATTISGYSGPWQPNDGDVNEIKFDLMTGQQVNFSLYIFDQNKNNSLLVLNHNDNYQFTQTIYFTNDNGTFYAGLTQNSKSLLLGTSPQYIIGFSSDGINFIYSYDVYELENDKSYKLIVAQGNVSDTVVQIDAAMPAGAPPVPLPGSALLLGSGLLGLALVVRRQKRRR